MTRIAVLADIHGNSIALDAVLEDIQVQGGADEYLVLGDLAAIGYDPVGTLDRLTHLPNVNFVRGNTDRYLVTGELPLPKIDGDHVKIALLDHLMGIASTIAWTKGAVTAAGWLPFLEKLQVEYHAILPDNTRLLGVHAYPGHDDGGGFYPGMDQRVISSRLDGCESDLVCVGHTHVLMEAHAEGVHVVNPGSVSNPFPPDLRASYILLDADQSGYQINPHYVDYDHDAVIKEVQRLKHPGGEYIIRGMRGQNTPRWN
ncbi:MAG: metallophosphoesterase family protein [Anaerolineaceae bacterium]|nr:metallophosphoesterase family protein [Anaerolineaceae bacterium]